MPIVHGGSDGDQFVQLGARAPRAHQLGLARLIHTVHRKHVLGEIDANVDNGSWTSPSE